METHIGKGVGEHIQKELFSASEHILISTPLISYSLGEKLIEIAKRGIKIKIITSETDVNDYKKAVECLRKFSKDITNTPEKHDVSLQIKVVSSRVVPLIHAKIYIIDNKCAITGSVNLTEDSFFNYPEYAIITREPNKIVQIQEDFENLWNKYADMSTKITINKKIKKLIWNIKTKL